MFWRSCYCMNACMNHRLVHYISKYVIKQATKTPFSPSRPTNIPHKTLIYFTAFFHINSRITYQTIHWYCDTMSPHYSVACSTHFSIKCPHHLFSLRPILHNIININLFYLEIVPISHHTYRQSIGTGILSPMPP